jgi:hypothetical protein
MRFATLLKASAAVLLAGCNSIAFACTEMGCENGLVVRFDTAPAGPYRVEAWSELRIAAEVFECAAGQTCPVVFFPEFEGHDVMVRVTTAAGTSTHEFEPVDYEPVYPNGRRCGAACEQAEVTVRL